MDPADTSARNERRISTTSTPFVPGWARSCGGCYGRKVRKSSIAKHQRAGAGSPLSIAIGRELRRQRRARGLTQASLGAPLTRGFISAVERGKTVPSIPALALLADRLDLPLDVFFLAVKLDMTVLYNPHDERRPNPPPRRRR